MLWSLHPDAEMSSFAGSEQVETAKELLRSARFQETPLSSSPRGDTPPSRDQAISQALSLLEAASGSGNAEGAYLLAEMRDLGEVPHPQGEGGEGVMNALWGGGRVYADAVNMGSRDAMLAMAVNMTSTSIWTSPSSPGTFYGDGAKHRRERPSEAEDLLRKAASGGGGGGLALLALGRLHYEESGAGFIEGAQGDEGSCQKAYEVLRPAADEAVKAIQESGGSASEGEQVRLSEVTFDQRLDEREGTAEAELLRQVRPKHAGFLFRSTSLHSKVDRNK
jgi:hypothetical protein